jgi:predicted nucleic acid-binding protein
LITAVDTNIFLDILIPNQPYLKSSLEKLENASKHGKIIICEIVYIELASQFDCISDLNIFLNDTHVEIKWSGKESLFNASRIWIKYRAQYSQKKFCPECGKLINISCPHCDSSLNIPRRILNDFIVGSHAKSFSNVFLTRDRGFYRRYFSGITIL